MDNKEKARLAALYLGQMADIQYAFRAKEVNVGREVNSAMINGIERGAIIDFKLHLRPKESLTIDEFKEFARRELVSEGDTLKFSIMNGNWCACAVEPFEVLEGWSDEQYITSAEEADYDNVLSYCPVHNSISHGSGDEMKFFVDAERNASWVAYCLEIGIDLLGLKEKGLAIYK